MAMDDQLKNAAMEGDLEFLRETLASNKPEEYFTSLYHPRDPEEERGGNIFHLAVNKKKAEFVRLALRMLPQHVVNFLLCQQEPYSDQNPLHYAASLPVTKILSLILDYYEKSTTSSSTTSIDKPWLQRDKTGNRPLDYMIENCFEECTLKLLAIDDESFCQMIRSDTDDEKNSLFLDAIGRCSSQVVREVLKNENLSSIWESNHSVLAAALAYAPLCSESFLRKVLVKCSYLLNKVDEDGGTILHHWIKMGKLWAFKLVLTEEFDASLRLPMLFLSCKQDGKGKTWLFYAAQCVEEEDVVQCVNMLLGVSPDFYTRMALKDGLKEGNLPLIEALSKKREKLALCFLSHIEESDLREVGGEDIFF